MGLDLSSTMLTLAQQKAVSRNVDIEWVEADCRAFALGRTFGLVFIPANSLTNLLDRKSLEDCLLCVRKHLRPGGRFVFHIYNPSLTVLTRDPTLRYPVGQFTHPYSGQKVIVTHSHLYETATQVNHILWHYQVEGGAEHTASLEMRVYYPQEIDALLHYNGYELVAKYGDWNGTPFTSASHLQIVVCETR